MVEIETLLLLLTIIFITFTIILCGINEANKRLLTVYKTGTQMLKDEIEMLEYELNYYKTLKIYNSNNSTKILDEDLKEVVKFAMKKSHPDNGGSVEEFDKFRKLYERIR